MRGKVGRDKATMYGNIDLSNLDYLEHRDLIRVAEEIKEATGEEVDPGYLSKVKRFIVKNTNLMAALLKKGGERRKKLETATA